MNLDEVLENGQNAVLFVSRKFEKKITFPKQSGFQAEQSVLKRQKFCFQS